MYASSFVSGFGLRLQRQHQAVFADGEADARSLGSADRLRQSVVAAAAEHCVLRAQAAVGELKRRARVVVESAHQAIVDRVGHAAASSMARTAAKCSGSFVEVIADPRQRVDDRLIFGNLAVEHAQRIGLGAALAVGAHLADDRLQRLAQRLR